MRRIKQFRIGKIIPFCLLFFLFCLVSNGYSQTDGVEKLIEDLKIPNLKVREESAETLGWIKDKRAVVPLIAILKDKDEDIGVRKKAAKALGKIKDERAIEALIDALKDEDVDVRWRAAEKFKEELTKAENLDRDISKGYSGFPVILKNPEDVGSPGKVLRIRTEVSNPDNNFVYTEYIFCNRVYIEEDEAKKFLLKGENISYTMDTTKDKYGNYRYIYAFIENEEGMMIGTTNITVPDPHDVSSVTFDFSDPDKNYVVEKERSVRKAAAWALARIGKPAVEALITALKDEDINVQRNVAWALGEIKYDKKTEEALTAALKDENLIVVAGAYKFFLEKSMADAKDILIQGLNEHGDKDMAETFLNCGNSELEAAAREWAEQHHHKIIFSLK